ncbi:MAG: GMP synthase [Cytophagaceae bacterium]|nr:GMP synthase [Cytophagaceae bacterium]
MNQPLRLAILDLYNGHPNEGMRCIRMLVSEFKQGDEPDLIVQEFDVRQRKNIPQLADFDLFISSGGPGDPRDTDGWGRDYFALIDGLFAHNQTEPDRKKYLFLICHSFQMVANHFGLGVVTKRRSTSFGTFPMHKTEAGLLEPFFELLPEPFYAVDSRDYQLTQPNADIFEALGAEILCIEKDRPHVGLERAVMAVRFSPEVFGTQFHPEADSEGMLHYFGKEEKRQQVISVYGEAKYWDMVEHLNDPDKIMLTESVLIPSFLHDAARHLST